MRNVTAPVPMPHPFRLRWLALSFLVGGSAWAQAESPSKTEPDPPAPADAPESADPAKEAGPGDDGYAQIELFTRVLEMVRQGYVDPSKTTYESLINSALEGMLRDLDPHCQFLTPKVYEQLQRDTSSTYEGVGITISPKNETLTIVTVREDGPAARAGVLPGDEILKINGILTKDVGLTEAVNLLRGKPGEKLKLTLNRSATKQLLELEMVREVLKQNSLVDIHLLDSKLSEPYKIGYARLLQFNEPSAGELSRALNDLEQKGMEAFVLDLRNNPGGLLDTAIDIIGEFVPAGTVVLTTEGRPGSGEVRPYRIRADHKQRDREYPVVILINGRGQRLGDLAAGTTVVTLKQRLRLQDTLMTAVPADHRVTFPEVMRLNDAQAAMIREVLNTTKVKDRVRIIEEMAAKVRRAIGNEGSGLGSKEFLEIVLRDYVHLTGQQTTNP